MATGQNNNHLGEEENMKRFLLVLLAVGLCAGVVYASEKDQAVALVDKAAAFVQAQGKEKALVEISAAKGQFDKGEIYVFAYDTQGVIVAHPKNPKLIGKNLLEVPDPDGKFFRKGLELVRLKGRVYIDPAGKYRLVQFGQTSVLDVIIPGHNNYCLPFTDE
jgi:hypothetical protein